MKPKCNESELPRKLSISFSGSTRSQVKHKHGEIRFARFAGVANGERRLFRYDSAARVWILLDETCDEWYATEELADFSYPIHDACPKKKARKK